LVAFLLQAVLHALANGGAAAHIGSQQVVLKAQLILFLLALRLVAAGRGRAPVDNEQNKVKCQDNSQRPAHPSFPSL